MSPTSSRPSGPFTAVEWAAIGFTIAVWGLNNVAGKAAVEALSPLLVGGVRFALAAPLLLPFVRPSRLPRRPADRWRLAGIAVLLGPLHFALVYVGLAMTDSLGPYVVALQVWIPLIAVMAWLFLREPIGRAELVGLAIAFGGVAWMTLDPHGGADAPAVGVAVLSCVAWAAGTLLVRRTPSVGPLTMQGVVSLAAAPLLLAGAYAQAAQGGGPDPLTALAGASPLIWATLVFAAVGSTVAGTAVMFWLVQRREPARVTPFFLLTPLVSCSLGVLLLGDVLTTQVVLGGLATLAGVAVVAWAERRRTLRARAAVRAEATTLPELA